MQNPIEKNQKNMRVLTSRTQGCTIEQETPSRQENTLRFGLKRDTNVNFRSTNLKNSSDLSTLVVMDE